MKSKLNGKVSWRLSYRIQRLSLRDERSRINITDMRACRWLGLARYIIIIISVDWKELVRSHPQSTQLWSVSDSRDEEHSFLNITTWGKSRLLWSTVCWQFQPGIPGNQYSSLFHGRPYHYRSDAALCISVVSKHSPPRWISPGMCSEFWLIRSLLDKTPTPGTVNYSPLATIRGLIKLAIPRKMSRAKYMIWDKGEKK